MSSNKKRQIRDEASIDHGRYFNEAYFRKETFDSLTFQLRKVYHLKPKTILEVGIGNAFVSDFLRKAGFDITTVDINPELKPDHVGGFEDLSDIFTSKKFDVVLCAEVLEHLVFESFENNVKNLANTASKYLVITIPRAQRTLLNIKLDFTIRAKIFRVINWRPWLFYSIPKKKISKLHHWEINHSKETSLKNIEKILKKFGELVDTGVVKDNHYHHYFVIKKSLN